MDRHQLLLTGVLRYVEQLGHQVLAGRGPIDEKERTTVGMRQQTHVHQYLVAEYIDVQLVGHVPYQLHEQLALVQVRQVAAVRYRAPGGRRTALLLKDRKKANRDPKQVSKRRPEDASRMRKPRVHPTGARDVRSVIEKCARE